MQKETKLLVESKNKEITLLKSQLLGHETNETKIKELNSQIEKLQLQLKNLENDSKVIVEKDDKKDKGKKMISLDQHKKLMNEKDNLIKLHLKTIDKKIELINQVQVDLNELKVKSMNDKQNLESQLLDAVYIYIFILNIYNYNRINKLIS